jgi:peptidyl-prolyl cis-trans isomerase SurA
MTLFGSKKIYLNLILIIVLFFSKQSYSIENKIIFKIENEIITSQDINNEVNYIKAFNRQIRALDEKKIKKFAENSLIRQTIKKLEILNFTNDLLVEKEFIDPLIKKTFLKMGINTRDDFNKYLDYNNLNIEIIEEKITIETIWNQLIFSKFNNKIKIDEKNLRKKILNSNNKIKNYLLSEIIFNTLDNNQIKLKNLEILQSISEIGFENTAKIYSISESSKQGGDLGWISENSLNKKITSILSKLKTNEITKPIVVPGGFLILKINEIKFNEKKIDLENELEILIMTESNRQLDQFSNIYFNKIKKKFQIDEL